MVYLQWRHQLGYAYGGLDVNRYGYMRGSEIQQWGPHSSMSQDSLVVDAIAVQGTTIGNPQAVANCRGDPVLKGACVAPTLLEDPP